VGLADAKTSALLIIECQNGVVGDGSALPALAKDAASTLPTIGRLAAGARDAGVLVCHLTWSPLAGNRASNRKPPLFRSILGLMDEWGPNHPATQPVAEIGVGPDDLVLPRASGISPTYGTETFRILRNLGIGTVVIAGVSLNIAIPAVLANAVDEDFAAVVPRDAVIGTPAEYAKEVLRNTVAMMATLTTVDELLAEWGVAS
jgi:nicotinamidase-related amidase